MGMATAPLLPRATPLTGDYESSKDNRKLYKKERTMLSLHSAYLHAKLEANIAPCCHSQSDFPTSHASENAAKKERSRQLWERFFSDPSQWRDNRSRKNNSRCPDFEHKTTFEGLWIESWLNPPWVKEKVATIAVDQMQSGSGSTSRVPNTFGNYDKFQKLCNEGRLKEALHLLELTIRQSSVVPFNVFVCLLKGCTRRKALAEGKQVHALIVQTKCDTNILLSNLLLNMYANCGSVAEAVKIFTALPQRKVFAWTAMILAYVNSGRYNEALTLFQQMQQAGIEPNKVTCIFILKACTGTTSVRQGKQLHTYITKRGFDTDVNVQTSLIDMYAKCGHLKDAHEMFINIRQRDVVCWNAMIAGYAQKGLGYEALDLYEQMKHEGMKPNTITFVVLLKACASISALEQGKQLHSLIIEKGLESKMTIQTALVDMYAKCGCLEDARNVFDNMQQHDVVSWSAMIAGYAQKGLGKEALNLYEQMKHEGLQADEVTYTCVLSACRHSCLVDEGRQVFESMVKDHSVIPNLEHYTCVVDLLGRAGFLVDAEAFILKMPIQPDDIVWMTLLGAARKYSNVEIGRRAFNHVVELNPKKDAAPYLLLIDIYSAAGRIDEIAKLRKEMMHKGFEKLLGRSWSEVDG